MWICLSNGVRQSQRLRFIRKKHSTCVIPIGEHRDALRLETGRLARFADGSAQASMGQTSVNVTVVSKKSPSSSGNSFLPFTVDYRQKSAAAGRIPTNYLRRELGPSQREILVSRVIDRSLRPLFPNDYFYETQCVANVLATDGKLDSDIVALNGASASLSISSVPWNGPIGAVRMGTSADRREIIINPTRSEREFSCLNLLLAGTRDKKAVVIEADGSVVDKHLLVDAIEAGLESCSYIAQMIHEWSSAQEVVKRSLSLQSETNVLAEVTRSVELLTSNKLLALYQSKKTDKLQRDNAMFSILEAAIPSLKESFPHINPELFQKAFFTVNKGVVMDLVFEDGGYRVDGRGPKDMRPISCQVDLHAPLHGSSLFQRGQTQVLCTVALDSIESSLKNDQMSTLTGGVKEKNFFLHYEFPKYATNDLSRGSGMAANRRELGHGALAEKALIPLIPKDYPFTIRLTSEVLESNGSSSMATVCGGSLALLDAGVKMSAPAAGVAIGLLSREEDSKQELLLDIIGQEDYLGDMDFKIAGTEEGITALQMDVKVPGLPLDVIRDATFLGQSGIQSILKIMAATLSSPRMDKTNLPKTTQIQVPLSKRSRFLGPSGYNIRGITSRTGVRISPGDKEDTWTVFAHNEDALSEAMSLIEESLVEEKDIEFTFGALYKVNILELNSSGINVQIHPAYPMVFIPNSQLSATKVSHPSALDLSVGQELMVKCYGRDPVSGSLRLSRKALAVAQSSALKSLPSKRSEVSSKIRRDTKLKSREEDKTSRMVGDSLLAHSELRYARSSVERLDRDLKDLTGKLERAQDGSFLSECYLPSFYERYKELLSRRNELSELLASRGRYSTEETREEDMSPSSASLFSDLEKNKVYKASVTHTADNGLTVNVIDEESRVAITGIFIPNAWVSKKSAENAEAGVELSLQFRGVDPISGVPRLVESHSLKRRAAPSDHNDIPFKTFKPTELFKLDVWSSSNLICSKFQGFLFEVSKMRSLRKTSEFFDHFRAQIRYCKDLNRLVSGPLSKTITLEIQEETKDIYTDMVYVMNLLRELHNESTTGFTLAKELSHFVESPGINDIDEDTDEPVMFSNFTHSYKIMEEHFASVVCDRSRIPGQILLDFEKRNLEEAIRVDREKIGQCLVCIIDSYCGFLRRNYLEFLNDWIDYDCLPPFAFHCSEIYETIKDDKDVEAIEDVRLFLHVINNIPPENTTFIMRQWISEELKSHLVPLCREYIECYEALMEQRRQWWNNQNALSIDEATLQEKYDYIIKWKNSMKEASMEVRFFEELLRIMPLSINYSDLVELNSLIRRSSQGDESAVSDLRVALGTFRNNLKAAITQQFTKK